MTKKSGYRVVVRSADELGIAVCAARKAAHLGLLCMTWADSPVVGAQCANCHTILWEDPRKNAVLYEKRPSSVPESGPGYTKYYEDNIKRYLKDLPPCPGCGSEKYNRLVNNVENPRFSSGHFSPVSLNQHDLARGDSRMINVYYLERDA